MDAHTLELLEFDKVRALVAAQAACSLGKEAALRMEPSTDPGEIRDRQALTTEMADALASGLSPPFGGAPEPEGEKAARPPADPDPASRPAELAPPDDLPPA